MKEPGTYKHLLQGSRVYEPLEYAITEDHKVVILNAICRDTAGRMRVYDLDAGPPLESFPSRVHELVADLARELGSEVGDMYRPTQR